MKIGDNKFLCPCGNEFEQVIKKTHRSKKSSSSDTAVCPKCGAFVSQK